MDPNGTWSYKSLQWTTSGPEYLAVTLHNADGTVADLRHFNSIDEYLESNWNNNDCCDVKVGNLDDEVIVHLPGSQGQSLTYRILDATDGIRGPVGILTAGVGGLLLFGSNPPGWAIITGKTLLVAGSLLSASDYRVWAQATKGASPLKDIYEEFSDMTEEAWEDEDGNGALNWRKDEDDL